MQGANYLFNIHGPGGIGVDTADEPGVRAAEVAVDGGEHMDERGMGNGGGGRRQREERERLRRIRQKVELEPRGQRRLVKGQGLGAVEMMRAVLIGGAAGLEGMGPVIGWKTGDVEFAKGDGREGRDVLPGVDRSRVGVSGEAKLAVGLIGIELGGEKGEGQAVEFGIEWIGGEAPRHEVANRSSERGQ